MTSSRTRRARRARGLRHARAALRARLSAVVLPLAAHQPSHRRLWRLASRTGCASRSKSSRDARGLAGGPADVGAHLRDRLGGRRPDRRRLRSKSRAFAEAGCDLIDVSTGSDRRRAGRSTAACSRPRSPTRSATRRSRDHVRRQHHHGRPGEHHPRRRAAPTSWRWPAASGRSRNFTLRAAAWYGVEGPSLAAAIQALRNAVKERADFETLKIAAKPKRHARGSFARKAAAE
jgi:hypothetical protein